MWRRHWMDLLLLAALAPLGIWAYRTGRERTEAEATYARLVAAVGELEIVDPARIYLKTIPTGRPLEFAWRVYLPAGPYGEFCGWNGSGMSSSGTHPKPQEGFLKIRLRQEEGGRRFMAHVFSEWSRKAVSVGDESLFELLQGRWDRVEVEQAGAAGSTSAPADKSLTMLRLKLPPDIAAEGRAKLSPYLREHLQSGFFEYKINP